MAETKAQSKTESSSNAVAESDAEASTDASRGHKNNDWSKRSKPKLLKGKEGSVSGDLSDLDKISTTDEETFDSGKDIFSMNESFKDDDKGGERMNSYKSEER